MSFVRRSANENYLLEFVLYDFQQAYICIHPIAVGDIC